MTRRTATAERLERRFGDVARELRARGFDPARFFEDATPLFRSVKGEAACAVDEVLGAFVVVAQAHHGHEREVWLPVGARLEKREGLALFAQLLMNGACALDDAEAVMSVLDAAQDPRPLRTPADVEGLAAYDVDGSARAQWEPPHVSGRTLRFCAVHDRAYRFGAVSVDVDTCAVAWEERAQLMPRIIRGRGYVDGRAPSVAALVLAAFLNGRSP